MLVFGLSGVLCVSAFLPRRPKRPLLASCHKHLVEPCHPHPHCNVYLTEQTIWLKEKLPPPPHTNSTHTLKAASWQSTVKSLTKQYILSVTLVFFPFKRFPSPFFLPPFHLFSWTSWEDPCRCEQMQNCLSVRAKQSSPKARAFYLLIADTVISRPAL